ncbi:MAG: hypothetical protein ACRDJP_13545 [Actinomycetota bacterium]
MTMLLCEPSTAAEDRRCDEATMAARTWLARQLLFERLLEGWRADDASE